MINTRLLLMMISTVFAVGCATPSSQQRMSATSTSNLIPKAEPMLVGAVFVRNVGGGQDTNPFWLSQVGTSEFRGALNDSLKTYGYSANEQNDARIVLDVSLQYLNQPVFELPYRVVSVVNYTVQARDSSTPVRVIPITATGTAGFSDTLLAAERLRLANERSIKANITEFIRTLGNVP